jgi:hypothetical protein
MIEKRCIDISLKDNVDKLYIEVICRYEAEYSKVIIQKEHTQVVLVEKNGEKQFDKQESDTLDTNLQEDEVALTFSKVFDFATKRLFTTLNLCLNRPNLIVVLPFHQLMEAMDTLFVKQ